MKLIFVTVLDKYKLDIEILKQKLEAQTKASYEQESRLQNQVLQNLHCVGWITLSTGTLYGRDVDFSKNETR